jgi:hypothetical protein
MISTIEITPGPVANTLAKFLLKHYAISNMHGRVERQELQEFIRRLLWANSEKEFYSGQAPGNE